MKVRTDFVTNSSSSSFIINRQSDYHDAESLYQHIKKLYYDWLSLIERINKDYGRDVTKISFDEQDKISDSLMEKYGISIFDIYTPCGGLEWLKCSTYKDYIRYWEGKENHILNYPFSIIGRDEMKRDRYGVVSWYVPCFNINNIDDDHYCDECKYCDIGCDSICVCDELKSGNFDSVDYFGDVCVCSESGNIPDPIVEKLSKECDLWCNHMG